MIVRVGKDPIRDMVQFYFFSYLKNDDNHLAAFFPHPTVVHKMHAVDPSDSFDLSREEAQRIMNSLWEYGFRPEGVDNEPQ